MESPTFSRTEGVNNINKIFQDLSKNMSQLIKVANYSISVLEKLRVGDY